jgi:hypothetical protein
MANKYLEKIAGLGSTLRRGVHDFGEHLSGKALEKAKMENSVVDGMSMASKIEKSTHADMAGQYADAKDWPRHANEHNRHQLIMNGQSQSNNHIISALNNGDHLNSPRIGHNIERLTKKRNMARGVVGGAGVAGLGGAFVAGHKVGSKKQ